MKRSNPWNTYIFRDGLSIKNGRELVSGLNHSLETVRKASSTEKRTALIDALLRAGELECALRDAAWSSSQIAEHLTDSLANALVCDKKVKVESLISALAHMTIPATVQISPPEGFAYYSLHPLAFADLVEELEPKAESAAVIGIRSIGTTLSAIVRAALEKRGINAHRTSVRCTGHPYDRETHFDLNQRRRIARWLESGSHFFVVDEGPGMSGSSFLSAGEALVAAGVPVEQITFLGTRIPDVSSLTARDARSRWPLFQSHYVRPNRHLPADAEHYIAGGIWRKDAFASEDLWPASWITMERLKFLTSDRERIWKFEGFGRFGAEVQERSRKLADAGFGPAPLAFQEGFGCYPMVKGEYMEASRISEAVVDQLASYCAFRAEELAVESADTSELQRMLVFNTSEEFGYELPSQQSRLELVRPVIADGRMLPYKWICTASGEMLKLDASSHGDDHFFPGPTDIAWDLAGAIIEWSMSDALAQRFIKEYRRISGDDPVGRLPAYLKAYAVFRMAYSNMAAAAMQGAPEQSRLQRDFERYRAIAEQQLGIANVAGGEIDEPEEELSAA